MSIEGDINKEIDELATEVINSSKKAADDLEIEINKINAKVSALLVEYSKDDGTISKSRLRSMLRELDAIEGDLLYDFENATDKSIEETIDKSESRLTEILIASLGASLLYGGLKQPGREGILDDISDYMFNTTVDGVSLSDSLRAAAGGMRDEIQKSIRQGVHRNETIKQIGKRAKKSIEGNLWTFQRIVSTEMPIAFRKTIVAVGGKAKAIKAVKIIDNRGRHRNHEDHMCYIYAEQDNYGWGKGVYKTTDTHILNPHPQCTAYYHYVLKKDALKEDDADVE